MLQKPLLTGVIFDEHVPPLIELISNPDGIRYNIFNIGIFDSNN